MIEMESNPNGISSPTNTSKVYVRFFNYTAYYEIDRVLPSVLDSTENGGARAFISNEEWLSFCDRIDKGFQRLNTIQCINFYCDLFIMVALILYLALVYIMYIFPFRSRFIVFLVFFAIGNALLHLIIRGPATTMGVNNAKRICEEETSRLNLRAGNGNSITILFHHSKRSCCNCEGYEFDRNERQRYHDIFVEVTTGSRSATIAYGNGETRTATATLVDGLYDDAPIATAAPVFPVQQEPYIPSPPFTNERAHARSDPYVTTPPPPMATALIVNDEEGEEDQPETQTVGSSVAQ